MNRYIYIILVCIGVSLAGCKKDLGPIEVSAEDYHAAIDLITQIQVHDIFSPPVSSRIFAYSNIAAYETLSASSQEYQSLAGQLNELTPVPKPRDTVGLNPKVAALVAFFDVSQQLIFSEERIEKHRDSLFNVWERQDPESFAKSKEYGLVVSSHIKDWMRKDNYAETRTMPKFSINSEEEMRWQPTPPSYMDGIEPHWAKIRPFVLKSPDQFQPNPHPEFSLEEGSDFFNEVMEVYSIKQDILKEGDSSERLAMAKFWDCNPYVSVTRGHLMFATKKITPGAHWIGIAKIANRTTNANFEKSVYVYTKTSLAIADAFISCWDEKFKSNLIRPETLINKYVDENWTPVLQTPPFPEYTSGHSVVSGAAAVTLTDIFGDNFKFSDNTEVPYGLPIRDFTSFNHAANEAAMSRMYGGIHYRSAIENGFIQGTNLGNYLVENIKMSKEKNAVASH